MRRLVLLLVLACSFAHAGNRCAEEFGRIAPVLDFASQPACGSELRCTDPLKADTCQWFVHVAVRFDPGPQFEYEYTWQRQHWRQFTASESKRAVHSCYQFLKTFENCRKEAGKVPIEQRQALDPPEQPETERR